MSKRDYVELVQDGLQWPLKKYFMVTRFTNLYHLSLDMARYKRARVTSTLAKPSAHKRLYYHKVTEILT